MKAGSPKRVPNTTIPRCVGLKSVSPRHPPDTGSPIDILADVDVIFCDSVSFFNSSCTLSSREEDFYVWTKKVENYVSGVFSNVRGALAFAAESQDVVTATTVAVGVPELGVEMSAETDGQLFVVLSALTDGESFDVVMSTGGDHGFESWRKLHGRWNPCTAGRARSLLREILPPSRPKLPELLCAIEKMEDLMRRYCSRRDAQGNKRTHPCGRHSHEFP